MNITRRQPPISVAPQRESKQRTPSQRSSTRDQPESGAVATPADTFLPMPTHPDEYQEHVLNAPDLCSNCMSIVRVERERPATGWRPAETFFSRNQATTSVEHVPAETVSESEQVFCECGVASAFDRYWTWRDVDRDRFRTLLKRLLRSLERKGLTIARQPAAAHALATYDEHPHVDHHGPYQEDHTGCIDAALADGLLAGLRIGSVRGADRSTA